MFAAGSEQSNLAQLVGSRVRVQGVCGSWFNKQRQLFGVRLLVSRLEDIVVEAPAATQVEEAARPIGSLLSFSPQASYNHRVKVVATVILQQPGRALFVQEDQHGLFAQTRQPGHLQPGDRVELFGFAAKGDYTPMLQDASWRKVGAATEPVAVSLRPDEALAALHDSRLVEIEGRLLDRAHNDNESVLLIEEDKSIFSAHLDGSGAESALAMLQIGSRLRLTGVCRIEVGDDWRSGPEWRAKSFRILLRGPADVRPPLRVILTSMSRRVVDSTSNGNDLQGVGSWY